MDYPRWDIMRNCTDSLNFGLNFTRQTKASGWRNCLVSQFPTPAVYVEIKDGSNFAPLYYREDMERGLRVNFDSKLYAQIREAAGLTGPLSTPDGTNAFRAATGDARPDEVKVFDYIYGALHSPAYRETYREFLKIDFPRVPYPRDPETFRHVSEKGEALRRLHLMEDAAIGETPFPFHGEGDSVVGKLEFAQGRVWINPDQYFDNVPDLAWTFPIGGYQPAQKWLKDRKGRVLTWDDVCHYQKIIKILCETDRIMQEIDMPLAPAQDVMAA